MTQAKKVVLTLGDTVLGVELKRERLHKQPRSLLKTIAAGIGNTREEPTLFSLPSITETWQGAIKYNRLWINTIGLLLEDLSTQVL